MKSLLILLLITIVGYVESYHRRHKKNKLRGKHFKPMITMKRSSIVREPDMCIELDYKVQMNQRPCVF